MSAVAPLREHARQEPLPIRRRPPERSPLARVSDADRAGKTSAVPRRERPSLQVVPRRRRAASIIATCCVVMFGLLLGTVALQTRIAQNQLALDKTERQVKIARERYDVLRQARAELRSPNRLAVEATRLGMAPAKNGEFMTIAPQTIAHLAATSGWLANNPAENSTSSFDQFGQVKAVAGDAP